MPLTHVVGLGLRGRRFEYPHVSSVPVTDSLPISSGDLSAIVARAGQTRDLKIEESWKSKDTIYVGHGKGESCLHVVIRRAGDDLDAVEGGGEDDDVAPGGVRSEGHALDRPHTERAVAAVRRPRQDLMALHCAFTPFH